MVEYEVREGAPIWYDCQGQGVTGCYQINFSIPSEIVSGAFGVTVVTGEGIVSTTATASVGPVLDDGNSVFFVERTFRGAIAL